MTELELFASIFPIIPEDVKVLFLQEQNAFGGMCECLRLEKQVFIPRNEMKMSEFNDFLDAFASFCSSEGIIAHGGALQFDLNGDINGKYFYI